MMNEKHIVLFSIWSILNNKGGIAKVFCSMANELLSRGYKVSAICFDENNGIGEPGFYLNPKIHFYICKARTPIYCLPPIRDILCFDMKMDVRHQKRGLQFMTWQSKKLEPLISQLESVDLFLTFQPEATYILKELMHISKPIVSMLHNFPLVYTDRPIFDILKPAMEQSNAVQVLMPEYVNIAKLRLQNVPIVYIPNVVPQYKEHAELESKTIICVARIDPEKNPELLLDAFNLIKDRFPDWKVEWWGQRGRYHCVHKLEQKIKAYGLTDRFILCGTTKNVKEKLLKASIFAFPSSFEGFSLALTEAMSLGLPVIGMNDCPSVNKIIENDSNGILVNRDANDFASALNELMSSKKKRMHLGAKAKIDMSFFSAEKVYAKWIALFDSILRKV